VASTELALKVVEILVFPGFFFLIVYALFLEWVDRKFFARLQNRYGPEHTGWKGILQPWADLIKLLAKEDITPAAADKLMFAAVPIVYLAIPLTIMFMVPIWGSNAYIGFPGDLIVVIFLFTLLILSVFFGGWSSVNRFGIVGGLRAALQMLSYEIPMALAAIGPAILAKSLSIGNIAVWPSKVFSGSLTPYSVAVGAATIFVMAVGFGIFTLCMIAELEKIPFDIPEAETEIVSGWQVEFSGRKLALLRLGSDIELVAASALMTALFLGGPLGPWPIPPVVWFIVKTTICVLIISNVRALFPRFRIDQMSHWMWNNIVPIAVLYIVAVEMLAAVM